MKKVYILFILSLVLAISGLTVSVDATDVIFDTSMTEIRDYKNLYMKKYESFLDQRIELGKYCHY
ncbi:hypothetical protein [uncultured Traorella sp.]|uniref:hypothetical protein n=1 Tax=uncultured Traorella sp. TaxID=1929048 RepID=UPI0025EAC272|nr:hypothetical protein [uncultured Traorella sp.]